MKCKFLFVFLVCMLALALAAPAFAAGPKVLQLTSPTHPDPWTAYYDKDPSFSWSGSLAPLSSLATPDNALGVAVAGGQAYVAQGYSGLQVADVSDPSAPALQGSWAWSGGYVVDVAVRGDYAYLADWYYGGSIIILDISDPDHPKQMGSAWGFDYAHEIALSGDYAYVAADGWGMRIVDVSNASSPQVRGQWGVYCTGIDVQGSYVYLAADSGLTILDISSPENPTFAGSLDLPSAKQIVVDGDYAYLTTYEDSEGADFQIVDIQDPTNPVSTGKCRVGGELWDVGLDGSMAYVACGSQGMRAVDVSDPSAPVPTRTFATAGYARDLTVVGGLAYVADGGAGLTVVDVATAAPKLAYSYLLDQSPDTIPEETVTGTTGEASYTDNANGTWWFHVRAVEVDADGNPIGEWGDTATIQVMIDHRPRIVDLRSPTHPDPWTAYYANDPVFMWDADVPSEYSFVIDQDPETQPDDVVDAVDDPDHPSYSEADKANGLWYFHVKAKDADGNWGDTSHLMIQIDHTPKIESVWSPTHPSTWEWYTNHDPFFAWMPATPVVGSYDTTDYAEDVDVLGDLAYIADGYAGLQIVDVSRPAVPVLVGSLSSRSRSYDVVVDSEYAYVADGSAGLQIIDVSKPAEPERVGSYQTDYSAEGIAVTGDTVYLAAGGLGLMVFDVTDRTNPQLVGTCSTYQAMDVAVSGGRAYVADGWDGLEVIDLTTSPLVSLGSCGTNGYARHILVSGGDAYVSTQDSTGLQVIDLSSDSSPDPVGWCATTGGAEGATIVGDDVYVACQEAGVVAIDVSDPAAPALHTSYSTPGSANGVAIAGDSAFVADGAGGLQIMALAQQGFGYSYSLDQSPDTEPDTVVDSADTAVSYTDVPEGTSWFHVRAVDAEGNWGPSLHYQINVKTLGPATMAVSARSGRRVATIFMQFAVSDTVFGWWGTQCDVKIEVQTANGRFVTEIPVGLKQVDTAYTAALRTVGLKKGRYTFIVHAWDWLGNPESQAGSASFNVK